MLFISIARGDLTFGLLRRSDRVPNNSRRLTKEKYRAMPIKADVFVFTALHQSLGRGPAPMGFAPRLADANTIKAWLRSRNHHSAGVTMDKMTNLQSHNQRSFVRAAVIASVCIVALLAFWSADHSSALSPTSAQSTTKASFAADGELHRPDGFRRWEHVGSRVKTSGNRVLDGAVILRPQVMDTYI